MNENLQGIWVIGSGYTLVALAILQVANLALTLLHSVQERNGKLWRYFGAIAGVSIPDKVGLPVFFVGLTILLWTVGLLGILGTVLWQSSLAFGCLGAVIGCRLSDSLFSHILLSNAGYRPNPGLPSVPLYFAEVLVLAAVFYPGLRAHAVEALIGFGFGALFFYALIPLLKKFGPLLFERTRPWEKGTPQPS